MDSLRRAILLAAGRGARLGDLTADAPKPLLKVAGVPIIARALESLAEAGISEVVVVAGYLADRIEEFCTGFAREHPALTIAVVRQASLDGTGGAMLAAMSSMTMMGAAERFLFGWGDILMDPEYYRRFANLARTLQYDLLLSVNYVSDPCNGAAVYLDDEMRVKRIVEKPARGTSTTNWNNAGLFASTPRLFDYVRRLVASPRGELELPEAIAAMVEDGLVVRAVELRGFWSDVGTPEDLAKARKFFPKRESSR